MDGGLGMVIDQQDLKQGLIHLLRRGKSVLDLQAAPDSPILPRFDPRALAAALECEIGRANICGFTKMSIHMDIIDAAQLVKFLRK
jgi:hypothetical protein